MEHHALSFYQPFASAIVDGIKTFDTRSWQTKYRGRLYIHASKEFAFETVAQYMAKEGFNDYLVTNSKRFGLPMEAFTEGSILNYYRSLPRAAVIGYVDLVDVISAEAACTRYDSTTFNRENTLGDLSTSKRFAWILKNPVKFKNPLTGIKGSLSVWNLTGYDYALLSREENFNPDNHE